MAKDLTAAEVRTLLRQACAKKGSQRQWALANDIDPVRVNLILSGREVPSERVLDALGLIRVTVYRSAETPAP